MPSNSEMYDRGALDAEHDDLNAFYYQHYYYYRKGYDDSRRQIRGSFAVLMPPWLLPLLGVLALALAIVVGAYVILRSRGAADTASGTTGTVVSGAAVDQTAAPAAAPTRAPPTPTAVPTPAPVMRVGGRARVVNVGDSPLRARAAPGLASSIGIVARFPEGSEVTVIEGPAQVDGLTWWRIGGDAGEGWSAERSADDLLFLEPLP